MIKRDITEKIIQLSGLYPVLTITGPRQSGKTTLIKEIFNNHVYTNLENPDTLLMAKTDPRAFLNQSTTGLVIDEVQNSPALLSYIQNIVDEKNSNALFILSGSQNLLLSEKISQTLAGRTAILKLLPFSITELNATGLMEPNADSAIFKGFYPRIFDKNIPPVDFYPFYNETYIERDVRQIKNIGDLSLFMKFIKMCAARIGQQLNITSLANDCGISQITAKDWLSILETTYIVYLLKPYYVNYNKRLQKMPKIYFYDTGLACSLLSIRSVQELEPHYLKGGLFENFVLIEFLKYYFNRGLVENIYFWREKNGHEIDLIIEKAGKPVPIEIKAGQTYNTDYFKGIEYWNKLSGNLPENSYVIYGGNDTMSFNKGNLISWKSFPDKIGEILS